MGGFYSNGALFRDRRRLIRYSSSRDVLRDQYSANVINLLRFEGPDGSTVFTDATGSTWTPSGNAQLDTAQAKFGVSSGLFDGSGDRITSGNVTTTYTFMHNGSVWTADIWVRPNVLASSAIFTNNGGSSGSIGIYIGLDSSGHLRVIMSKGGGAATFDFTSTGTLVTGAWQLVSVVHDPSQAAALNTYIDGVSAGSANPASTYSSLGPSNAVTMGTTSSSTLGYNGWIDETRITSGIARYTGDFVPSALPFPNL